MPAPRVLNLALPVLTGLALVVSALAGGCTVNPSTGRLQFNTLSRDEEIALGQEAAPELVAEYGGEVPDAALRAYVSEVGRALVPHTEGDGPELPWQFTLLDSDVINAFALPGGQVFMSRGLAAQMTNEAQLAGVLGHEIGHVMAEHVDDRIARAQGVQVGAGLIGAVVGEGAGVVGQAAVTGSSVLGQGYLLRFSRGQELEADELGMRYMARAGYDPVGQRQVMEILLAASGGSGGGFFDQFLATHPDPQARIDRIDRLLADEYDGVHNNPQYRLNEAAFRQRFLSRLSALPPAANARTAAHDPAGTHGTNPTRDRGARASDGAASRRGVMFAHPGVTGLGGAHAWCGLCAGG